MPRNPDRAPYWQRTHWPLQGLYFLLPLVVLYEIGVVLFAGDYDITARSIIRQSLGQAGFQLVRVTGYYLPGIILLVFLLSMHAVRQDPWRPQPWVWVFMWIESLVLAAALFVFTLVLFRNPEAATLAANVAGNSTSEAVTTWQAGLVFSIGAGIYEELLFRLLAIAMLHFLVVDLLGLEHRWGVIIAIVGSSLAFALYHFIELHPGGPVAIMNSIAANFHLGLFIFYLSCGIYLAAVYLTRGFGIVVATHALYDVFVVSAHFSQN